LNRYAYVRNNPVKHTDPSGESFEDSEKYAQTNYGIYAWEVWNPKWGMFAADVFEQNRQRMWNEDYANNVELQQEFKNAATIDMGVVRLCSGCMTDNMREDPIDFLGKVGEGAVMVYTLGGATQWISGKLAVNRITSFGSKTDVLNFVRNGWDDVSNAVKDSAKSFFKKASADDVVFDVSKNGDDFVMSYVKPGGDGQSYVLMEKIVDSSGTAKSLVQYGYNKGGDLIHIHDKLNKVVIV